LQRQFVTCEPLPLAAAARLAALEVRFDEIECGPELVGLGGA